MSDVARHMYVHASHTLHNYARDHIKSLLDDLSTKFKENFELLEDRLSKSREICEEI